MDKLGAFGPNLGIMVRLQFRYDSVSGWLASVTRLVTPLAVGLATSLIYSHAADPDFRLRAIVGPAVFTTWYMLLYLNAFAIAIERAQGTLEMHLASPVPLALAFAGKGVPHLGYAAAGGFLTGLVSWAAMGAGGQIEGASVVRLAIALPVIFLALAGFSMIVVPLYLLLRSPLGLLTVLVTAGGMFSGTLFPPDALPAWAGTISALLPTRSSTELLLEVLREAEWADLAGTTLRLLLASVAYWSIALGVFLYVGRRARLTGSVSLQ